MSRIVLALGGNSLQQGNNVSAAEQLSACKSTAIHVAELVEQGHQVAITHGNGPQVGEIVADLELANKADSIHPIFSFDICTSFTQGYIGYHLQNCIREELVQRKINLEVASIITQVEVDPKSPAFSAPSKPIGSFYSETAAKQLSLENPHHVYQEDAGRGWRRVVASPKPLQIVEKQLIKNIFDAGSVVISCGGGGIPVVKDGYGYKGIEAVIDKDFVAAKLAESIDADILLILTAVPQVAINYNTPQQKNLAKINVSEAYQYIQEGHFAPGSMLPKVEAALNFVSAKPGRKALITAIETAKDALNGKTGTFIYND